MIINIKYFPGSTELYSLFPSSPPLFVLYFIYAKFCAYKTKRRGRAWGRGYYRAVFVLTEWVKLGILRFHFKSENYKALLVLSSHISRWMFHSMYTLM